MPIRFKYGETKLESGYYIVDDPTTGKRAITQYDADSNLWWHPGADYDVWYWRFVHNKQHSFEFDVVARIRLDVPHAGILEVDVL